MTETKRDLWDVILKIVIAVMVPITIALIGIYGETIVAKYSASQQELARLGRRAEAETEFRREMFASLFTGYVDQISETNDPIKLDALTTRLELLATNFSDFLNLRPLFLQLERKIVEVFESKPHMDLTEIPVGRAEYLKRLRNAAQAVVNEQTQKIKQYGKYKYVRIPLDFFGGDQGSYSWPHRSILEQMGELDAAGNQELYDKIYNVENLIILDGVNYSFEIIALNPNFKRKQIRINFLVSEIGSDRRDIVRTYSSSFQLNNFAFPVENNMTLSRNHRAALTLEYFGNRDVEIGIYFFPNTLNYSGDLDAVYKGLSEP